MKVHEYQKLLIKDVVKVWWNLMGAMGILIAIGEDTRYMIKFTAETAGICAGIILFIYFHDRSAK